MEFSIKQCMLAILGFMVLMVGSNALIHNLNTQGAYAKNISSVMMIDFVDISQKHSSLVDIKRKPQLENTIFHMRKGNYEKFDYLTLVVAYDHTNAPIAQDKIEIQGTIDGKTEGVSILYCTVFDNEGNYKKCKLAVIIEGDNDSEEMIYDYKGGVLR